MGTGVSYFFPAASVDSPPPGDIPTLFLALLSLPGRHERRIAREGPRGSSLALLKDNLASQEECE
jgi:hypothetical protein